MKQLFQKISAILMALVVLFSTMSFTLSEHYCGDHLVNSALFTKAESCGMELEKPSPTKDCSIKKSNCCSDVLKQIEGQSELKTNFSNFNFEQQVFVASFIYSYINVFEELEENSIPSNYYSPPLLVKDIQILDEVFLI